MEIGHIVRDVFVDTRRTLKVYDDSYGDETPEEEGKHGWVSIERIGRQISTDVLLPEDEETSTIEYEHNYDIEINSRYFSEHTMSQPTRNEQVRVEQAEDEHAEDGQQNEQQNGQQNGQAKDKLAKKENPIGKLVSWLYGMFRRKREATAR